MLKPGVGQDSPRTIVVGPRAAGVCYNKPDCLHNFTVTRVGQKKDGEKIRIKFDEGASACFDSLADLYVEQGKLAEAEPLYERALAIRVEKLGADHPSVAETLEAYTELLRSSGRAREADEVAKSLAVQE